MGEKPKYVCDFSTVGDFWRLFNNLTTPSNLPPGSDLHLFKGSIEPEWEHPLNKGGGIWTVNLKFDDTNYFDLNWFHTILTMVGNNFEDRTRASAESLRASGRGSCGWASGSGTPRRK